MGQGSVGGGGPEAEGGAVTADEVVTDDRGGAIIHEGLYPLAGMDQVGTLFDLKVVFAVGLDAGGEEVVGGVLLAEQVHRLAAEVEIRIGRSCPGQENPGGRGRGGGNAVHLPAGKPCIGGLSAASGGAGRAGAGAGAGIAYLNGGDVSDISHTIVNALAITSGIVCDGAKSSCAAKIATAVETGIFGYEMYRSGQQFYGGDGLVAKGVEKSIDNFGRLAREGMRETDQEIILMMTEQS